MTFLRDWLFGIVMTAMVLSVVYSLIPKGKFQAIARCAGGLLMLLVMIRPLLGADWEIWDRSYDQWETAIGEQTQEYRIEQIGELSAIIAEKTAAYIQDKAAALGTVCCAEVVCEERNGVPFPSAVSLNTPYDETLSGIIREELDIPAERQYWQEEQR